MTSGDRPPSRGCCEALRDAVLGWWLPLRAGSGVRCCCCCPLKIPCESVQLVHAQGHCLYVNVDAEQQQAVELQRAALPAKTRDAVRVIVVSDTHSQHNALGTLPAGDVFVHCGDILMSGRLWSVAGQVAQMTAFNEWLGCVPCATKVVIAGNHEQLAPVLGRQKMAALLSNAKYLENEARGVDGLRVFATPLSKGHSSNGAFQDDAFAAATVAAAELAGRRGAGGHSDHTRTVAGLDHGELHTVAARAMGRALEAKSTPVGPRARFARSANRRRHRLCVRIHHGRRVPPRAFAGGGRPHPGGIVTVR